MLSRIEIEKAYDEYEGDDLEAMTDYLFENFNQESLEIEKYSGRPLRYVIFHDTLRRVSQQTGKI